MSLYTDAPIYSDSDNTLLLKIAYAYWVALSDTDGLNAPLYGDSDNQLLLKIAQYLERL